ncbi:hypothetical protein [Arenimonas sp.]|uniref:hypothetical protein n=1 Tax=Arenimonas sp. TaxID=1872635 RepID=UPI0039E677E0
MKHLISAMLVIVAIIHLLPVIGALGSDKLATLYGLDFSEPNLAILMRHRAVLFGLLGSFFLVAAFRPAWQPAAFVMAFASLLSFCYFVWSAAGHNAQVHRVMIVDVVAIVALVVAVVAWWLTRSKA